MRPHQILTKRPDGTIPFTQAHPAMTEKPGSFFEKNHAAGKELQRWERATVDRLKDKPRADWTKADLEDFTALKYPSLQGEVEAAHRPKPAAPVAPEKPTFAGLFGLKPAEWTPAQQDFFKSLAPADQGMVYDHHEGMGGSPKAIEALSVPTDGRDTPPADERPAPGPETNGAAVSKVMKQPAEPEAAAFTKENTPEATPAMLELLNSAPPDKIPELLEVVRAATPPMVRISQMKGILK